MAVDDQVVKLNFRGTTKALFDIPTSDYRFRLTRPSWPREEQVVTVWDYPGPTERVVTEGEIVDDGEFLWIKPADIVSWTDPVLDDYRLTIMRRTPLTQTWEPTASSRVDQPATALRLDRLTRIVQELWEGFVNALRFHPQENDTINGDEVHKAGRTLPLPADRANRGVAFGPDGLEIVMVPMNALSIQLSSNQAVLDATASGNIPDVTDANTTVKVLQGTDDETGLWTLSATPSAGITGGFTGAVYQVTAATQSGWVDILATRAGSPSLTARFQVTGIHQGATARVVSIGGPQVFTFPKGSPTPSPNTPKTLTATIQNFVAPASPQWQYHTGAAWANLADESGKVSGGSTLALSITHDAAVWGTERQLRLKVVITDIEGSSEDEATIYKVADGLDAYTVVLDNPMHGISCDAYGKALTDELGAPGRARTGVKVYSGKTLLTGVTGVPVAGQFRIVLGTPTGCTATIESATSVRIDTVTILAKAGAVPMTIQLEGITETIPTSFGWAKVVPGNTPIDTIVAYTPRYKGTATADLPVAVVGDRYYNTLTKKIRKLEAGGWADDASSDGFALAMLDIYTTESAATTQAQAVQFIQSLVAKNAFIDSLGAKFIKLITSGSIRGGDRFDSAGAVIDASKTGFFLGADGKMKVSGLTFEGINGGGVAWGAPVPIGTNLTISGAVSGSNFAVMSPTDIAFFHSANKTITRYRFNGSTWTAIGTSITIATATNAKMAALSDTDLAFSDSTTGILRTLRWSHVNANWTAVGTNLTLSSVSAFSGDMDAISPTDIIAVAMSDFGAISFAKFRFTANAWSRISGPFGGLFGHGVEGVKNLGDSNWIFFDSEDNQVVMENGDSGARLKYGGPVPAIAGGYIAVVWAVPISASDIVASTSEGIRVYRVGSGMSMTLVGSAGSAGTADPNGSKAGALNGSDIVVFNPSTSVLRVMRMGFALSDVPWRQVTG